jgi:hypothetical protein
MTAEDLIRQLKKARKIGRRRPDPEKMDPEEAMDMAEAIGLYVGEKAQERMESLNREVWEMNQEIETVDKAWSHWNWRTLQDLNLISKEDSEFVRTVHAMYTW